MRLILELDKCMTFLILKYSNNFKKVDNDWTFFFYNQPEKISQDARIKHLVSINLLRMPKERSFFRGGEWISQAIDSGLFLRSDSRIF